MYIKMWMYSGDLKHFLFAECLGEFVVLSKSSNGRQNNYRGITALLLADTQKLLNSNLVGGWLMSLEVQLDRQLEFVV